MTSVIISIQQELMEELGKQEQDFIGCTPENIHSIKTAQGISYLPQIYLDFLLKMGQRAGGLFIGTDCFCDQLSSLKKFAIDLLEEDRSSYKLPEDAFVFLVHQGYQFMFFHTEDGSDDPIIYYYIEGDMKPTEKEYTFSRFLHQAARNLISRFKQP